ncbi:hypothetical protein CDD83_9734 [Cordyceps sp. RAO-2017]|nr:hypothetical protein CDD83_9734 [Cordyceps sp. RAO-2017]
MAAGDDISRCPGCNMPVSASECFNCATGDAQGEQRQQSLLEPIYERRPVPGLPDVQAYRNADTIVIVLRRPAREGNGGLWRLRRRRGDRHAVGRRRRQQQQQQQRAEWERREAEEEEEEEEEQQQQQQPRVGQDEDVQQQQQQQQQVASIGAENET